MFRVFAPAKINLCLAVTGQRADGYHLLDTVVGFADVGDFVTVAHGARGLEIMGPESAGLMGDNIITRVMAAFGGDGLSVILHKNLPVASGIGGGSSDAAATYRGLCAVQNRSQTAADMAQLLALGADVPMCAAALSARARGIGEDITPLPNLARLHAVLVNPRVHVATPQVFNALIQKENTPLDVLPADLIDPVSLVTWLTVQRNDLQPAAIQVAPVIAHVLAEIADTGADLVRMSGSGATCFGIYQGAAAARAAGAALRAAHPNWWVAPCIINGGADVSPQAIRATT
jgi:4-diphosphocytidyl-2-C-methyl-D-erythritol kinase